MAPPNKLLGTAQGAFPATEASLKAAKEGLTPAQKAGTNGADTVALLRRLQQKLSERTGELSPEAAKFIKNLSPDQAVTLDQMLEAGGKLEEVKGTGTDSVLAKQYGDALALGPAVTPEGRKLLAAAEDNYFTGSAEDNWWKYASDWWDKHGRPPEDSGPFFEARVPYDTTPIRKDRSQPGVAPRADTADLYHRQTPGSPPPNRADKGSESFYYEASPEEDAHFQAVESRDIGEATAINSNFRTNEHRPAEGSTEAEMRQRDINLGYVQDTSVASWPKEWKKWENIPGIAAGAVGAGTVLASSDAEAAPPKLTPMGGAEANLAGKLAKSLESRTGPLSPEGAKFLQNLSPDQQVTLDGMLQEGGQLGEVSGTGVGGRGPVWDANGLRGPAGPGGDVNTQPNAVDAPSYEDVAVGHATAMADRRRGGPTSLVQGPSSAGRTQDIRHQNFDMNGAVDDRRWPSQRWYTSENIPGLAAGAVGAGVLLSSPEAQAAPPKGLDLRASGYLPQLSTAIPNPDEFMSSGQPKKPLTLTEQVAQKAIEWGRAAIEPIQQFEQHYIDPIVYANQIGWQQFLFNRVDPKLEERFNVSILGEKFGKAKKVPYTPYDPEAPGELLRAYQPGKALVGERFFKYMIGTTGWNRGDPSMELIKTFSPFHKSDIAGTPEDMDPAAILALNNLSDRHGEAAVGAVLSLATWLPEIPMWMLPGVGKGVIAQGATAGLLTGLADPDIGIVEATAGGAFMGGLFKGAGKAYGWSKKAVEWGKSHFQPEFTPIAVINPDQLPGFATRVFDQAFPTLGEIPPSAIPDPSVPRPAPRPTAPPPKPKTTGEQRIVMVVQEHVDEFEAATSYDPSKPTATQETPRRAILVVDEKGFTHAEPLVGDLPEGVPVIDTNGDMIVTASELAAARKTMFDQMRELEAQKNKKAGLRVDEWDSGEMSRPSDIYGEPSPTMTAQERAKLTKSKGLVLAIQQGPGGVSGTAGIHQLADPALQRKVIEARRPFWVNTPTGRKMAFLASPAGEGKVVVAAVDPAEGFTSGLAQDMEITKAEFGDYLSPDEIDVAMSGRQNAMEETALMSRVADQLTAVSDGVPTPLRGQQPALPPGEPVIPSKALPSSTPEILPPEPGLRAPSQRPPSLMERLQSEVDAEFSMMNGGGMPPGHLFGDGRIPLSLLEGKVPLALPENAGVGVDWIAKQTWLTKIANVGKAIGKTAAKWGLSEVHWLPDELAEAAMRMRSVHYIEDQRLKVFNAIVGLFPELGVRSQARANELTGRLMQYVKGTLRYEELRKLEPGLDQHTAAKFQEFKQTIDSVEQELVDLQMINPNRRTKAGLLLDEVDQTWSEVRIENNDPLGRGKGAFKKKLPKDQAQKIRAALKAGLLDEEEFMVTETGDVFQMLRGRAYEEATGIEQGTGKAARGSLYDYFTRSYWAYMMPKGEWAKMFKADKRLYADSLREMIKVVEAHSIASNRKLDPAAVRAIAEKQLDDLVRGDDSSIKARQSLRARNKAMPEWVARALGEIEAPHVVVADTLARQRALRNMGLAWKMVAENPNFSIHPDQMGKLGDSLNYTKVTGRRYGMANGMYIRNDVLEGLESGLELQMTMNGVWHKINNYRKWMGTVGRVGTWTSNVLGNMQGVALSNVVNMANPADWVTLSKGLRLAAESWVDYGKNPLLTGSPLADNYLRAMEYGILGSDVVTAEFRQHSAQWGAALMKYGREDAFSTVYKAGVNSLGVVNSAYAGIDPTFKFAVWNSGLIKAGVDVKTGAVDRKAIIKFLYDSGHLKQMFTEDAARRGVKLTRPEAKKLVQETMQSMTNAELRKRAEVVIAQKIHRSFPMNDRLGKLATGLANLPFSGLIANSFVRTASELTRVMAQLPWRAMNEPGMTGQILAYALASAGLYVAWDHIAESNGIGPNYIEAVKATQSESDRYFRPGRMFRPMRNADGSVDAFDATKYFEPLRWLIGADQNGYLKSFAMAMFDVGFGGTPAGETIKEGAQNLGLIKMPDFNTKVPESDRTVMLQALRLANQAQLIPGSIESTRKALEQGGFLGYTMPRSRKTPANEVTTPLQTAGNILAGPGTFTSQGSTKDVIRARQFGENEIKRIEREQKNLMRNKREGNPTGPGGPPLDKKAANKRLEELKREHKLKQQELNKTLRNRNKPTKQ